MSGIWSARDPGMPSDLHASPAHVVAVLIGVVNAVEGYIACGAEVGAALLAYGAVCNFLIWRPEAFGYPASYAAKLARPFPTHQAGTVLAWWCGWVALFIPTALFVFTWCYARFTGA